MQAAKHVSGLLAFDAALMSAYQSSENTEDVGLLSYEQLVRHYPARFGSWQEEKALEFQPQKPVRHGNGVSSSQLLIPASS
jgi:hypothetical protein